MSHWITLYDSELIHSHVVSYGIHKSSQIARQDNITQSYSSTRQSTSVDYIKTSISPNRRIPANIREKVFFTVTMYEA